MNPKSFISLIMLFAFCFVTAQDNSDKFEIGVNGNLFISGEYNSIYGVTTGVEAQYYFSKSESFNHFLNAGFTTDIDTDGANLYFIDLGIGTKYHLGKVLKRSVFLEGSLGALYSIEKFSTQLLNNTVDSTFTEFGFKARLGITYEILNQINLKLHATQFSVDGTAVGLGLSYSF